MWIVVLIAVATALGAQSAKNPKGVFSMIKLGQAVNLKDQGAAYSISFMEPEVPLGHTVVVKFPRNSKRLELVTLETTRRGLHL